MTGLSTVMQPSSLLAKGRVAVGQNRIMTVLLPGSSPINVRSDVHHVVRLMTGSDLDIVVAWHRRAFPTGFYAQLGSGFMKKWFYAHINSPAAVSLVACDEQDAVVGYLIATTDDAQYRNRSTVQGLRMCMRGGVALAARPQLWSDFARVRARHYAARCVRAVGRKMGDETSRSASQALGNGDGELVYICIEPDHRRRGAGAALLESFTGEAVRSNTKRLHLVTERDNSGAQQFYGRHGWHVMDDTARLLDGRTLVRIQKYIGVQTPCVG